MYLRGLRSQSNTSTGLSRLWSQTSPGSVRFSQLRRLGTEHQQQRSQSKHGCGGLQHGAKRAAIRPFWIFALCIPFGYGLNWALKEQDGASASTTADGFVRYTLASKEDISSTCSIFTLSPATSSAIRIDDPALKRAVVSVQFKQPELQIARNYTLLPPLENQDSRELRFLIRKEQNGEVSGYLHRLKLGSEIEVRGLNAEYILPEKVDTVLFLAGGTGIAPAMQVADASANEATVHILWANRRREDCVGGTSDIMQQKGWDLDFLTWLSPFGLPSVHASKQHNVDIRSKGAIVSQLERLKLSSTSNEPSSRDLLIDYFVDEEGTFIGPKGVGGLMQSLDDSLTPHRGGKKLLLVSGPEGFVKYWAGPKQWINGREVQGPLGGVLSTLDSTGWEIVKL